MAGQTLTGCAGGAWRYADRFVDGLLIGAEKPTVIENSTWGRIKAAFGKQVEMVGGSS
jgi:hypothetical protein